MDSIMGTVENGGLSLLHLGIAGIAGLTICPLSGPRGLVRAAASGTSSKTASSVYSKLRLRVIPSNHHGLQIFLSARLH
jgi:hypothetical protein